MARLCVTASVFESNRLTQTLKMIPLPTGLYIHTYIQSQSLTQTPGSQTHRLTLRTLFAFSQSQIHSHQNTFGRKNKTVNQYSGFGHLYNVCLNLVEKRPPGKVYWDLPHHVWLKQQQDRRPLYSTSETD